MTPQGNWLHVALMLAPAETPGGLLLPERRTAQDAIVLNAPKGRVLPGGARYPIDIRDGDRVIAAQNHIREWGDGEGFVRVEEVVAVIPGPGHREILAANEYVLVVPKPIPRLRATEAGVLVSHVRLRGGQSRDLERGERLLQEFTARGRKLLQAGITAAERQDILYREIRDLPPVDREALKAAWAQDGDTGYKFMRPPSSAVDPRRGVLHSVGPGQVGEDGRREEPNLCGLVGEQVFWEKEARIVELWDGRQVLFALDWRRLCATPE